MQKWEYKSVSVQRSWVPQKGLNVLSAAGTWQVGVDKDWLEKFGAEGWELVSIVPLSDYAGDYISGFTTSLYFYFKRPIE